MDIFNFENGIAVPSEHAYLISPFKDILARDKSNSKESAIKEFTYIELMCSQKKTNPLAGYPEDIKPFKVSELVFNQSNYQPDDLVKAAIEAYNKYNQEASPSMAYYLTVKKAAEKIRSFLDTVDLHEKSKLGAAVYKPTDITKAISDSVAVINNLQTLKEKVQQELFETTKTRGAREIGEFER